MLTYGSAGAIAGSIFLIILFYVALSALGAVILWGCARGIGKVENATYLNSWGLFWILTLAQLGISLVLWGLAFLFALDNPLWIFSGGGMVFVLWYIVFYLICLFIALIITKAFWKCTFKQAVLTHMIPVIVYTCGMIFYFIFFLSYATSGPGYYPY